MNTIRNFTKGHGATTLAYGAPNPLADSILVALFATGTANFTLSGGVSGGGNWQRPLATILGDNSQNSAGFYCVAAGGATTVTCSVTIVEGVLLEIAGSGLAFVVAIVNDLAGAVAVNSGTLVTPPTFSQGFAIGWNCWSGANAPVYNGVGWVKVGTSEVNNETMDVFFQHVTGPNQQLRVTSSNSNVTGPGSGILLFSADALSDPPRFSGLSPQQRAA